MKRNIVIMDFSGIYQEEQFYEGEQISWIDLSDISGTNCYCDGDAQAQILERMEKYPVSGIYFIDSGNYHYMSRIGIGRVKEPFNLLVFDNHTDMQLPAFGGLLSCGGWIASALEEVEKLHEVWLIGPDEEAYGQPTSFTAAMRCYRLTITLISFHMCMCKKMILAILIISIASGTKTKFQIRIIKLSTSANRAFVLGHTAAA